MFSFFPKFTKALAQENPAESASSSSSNTTTTPKPKIMNFWPVKPPVRNAEAEKAAAEPEAESPEEQQQQMETFHLFQSLHHMDEHRRKQLSTCEDSADLLDDVNEVLHAGNFDGFRVEVERSRHTSQVMGILSIGQHNKHSPPNNLTVHSASGSASSQFSAKWSAVGDFAASFSKIFKSTGSNITSIFQAKHDHNETMGFAGTEFNLSQKSDDWSWHTTFTQNSSSNGNQTSFQVGTARWFTDRIAVALEGAFVPQMGFNPSITAKYTRPVSIDDDEKYRRIRSGRDRIEEIARGSTVPSMSEVVNIGSQLFHPVLTLAAHVGLDELSLYCSRAFSPFLAMATKFTLAPEESETGQSIVGRWQVGYEYSVPTGSIKVNLTNAESLQVMYKEKLSEIVEYHISVRTNFTKDASLAGFGVHLSL